jgi:hypothetical protein
MKKSKTLQKLVRLSAIAMAIGAMTPVFAQSNATGILFGKVDAGATLVITNLDSGASRSIAADASGHYSLSSLATGNYKVEALKGGASVGSRIVEVRVGQGVEASIVSTNLGTVQISGSADFKRAIDTSTAGTTTTFSASELAKLPVASTVAAVIQLAPNTTKGDRRYGGADAPSFGGAGASENAYYLNGMPITNLYLQVGFPQMPSNAMAQAQVLTGGYGAEFGRSTGGVVNLISKRGTNDYVFGVGASTSPAAWRATQANTYWPVTGDSHNTATDGTLYYYNNANQVSSDTQSFYFGGPLVQDKLFAFLAYEGYNRNVSQTRKIRTDSAAKTSGWQDVNTKDPRYLLKLDWNITDNHALEYTKVLSEVTRTYKYSGFDYSTLTRNNIVVGGTTDVNWDSPQSTLAPYSPQGADIDILKYTGYLTDNLTVQLLAGKAQTKQKQTPVGYDPSFSQVTSDPSNEYPGLGPYAHPQAISGAILVPGAQDKNIHLRADLEWKFNEQHTLRVGVDKNDISSLSGTADAGGTRYIYGFSGTPGIVINKYNTKTLSSITGNPLAAAGYYVSTAYTSSGSSPSTIQSAQYIEDRWAITDRVQLTLGLRNEGFDNRNGDGQTFLSLPTQIAPRVGVAWDVNGDSSYRIFGSGGRYHLPIPTSVAVRQLGSSTYVQQFFAYTGVGADGRPTGLTPLSPLYSSNNEYGQAKDFHDYINLDLKTNSQDEFAVGFEKAISKDLNIGARVTYRYMNSTIDDVCDNVGLINYAIRNNLPSAIASADANCRLFNPGMDNAFQFDFGDGRGPVRAVVTNADMGNFPTPERTYKAVDLYAEHPFNGVWYGKVNYTWAQGIGNMEGQLNSDLAQADVGATVSWDFPQIMAYTSGRMPNTRTHQIKAFGFYQLAPEWGIGANVNIESGRPLNCFGNAPTTAMDPYGYGPYFNYCAGQPSQRGSVGDLPWTYALDLGVTYKPALLKGVTMKLDVLNVLNAQLVASQTERRENAGDLATIYSLYGYQTYTAPRSATLSVNYDYKF